MRLAALVIIATAGSLQSANAQDDRRVWQYRGGFGPSWFVHEEGPRWIIYRGDGQTFLYVEEKRTPTHISLRGPQTGLLIRLSADRFETRRKPDQPSRRSAGGRWVTDASLPRHIREAPRGYQIRLVYFVPSDRQPAAQYEAKIRLLMSMVSELLHADLRSKGYRPRQLEFESRDGAMLVHLVRAKQPAEFYTADAWPNTSVQAKRIHDELRPTFGDSARNLTVVFAETYGEGPAAEAWSGHIALGSAKPPEGGFAVYSTWVLKDLFTATTREEQLKLFFDQTPVRGRKAFGSRVPNSPRFEFVEDAFGATIHELGHALGCPHDYRASTNIMGSGFRRLRENFNPRTPAGRRIGFSRENARLLMASRYLAPDVQTDDYDAPTVTLELKRGRALTAVIKAEDNAGLKTLLLRKLDGSKSSVIGGRRLEGSTQSVVERLPPDLVVGGKLQVEAFVADVGGNVARVTATLGK